MNLFTANQVNHVYVVKDVKTGNTALGTTPGAIKMGTDENGYIYFEHVGPSGVTRSDLIDPKTVTYINDTVAADLAKTLKQVTIAFASGVSPVAGQDYFIRLAFDGYIGISPEDSQYWKYAVATATSTTASDLYKALAKSLDKNMSREAVKFIEVGVNTSGGFVAASSIASNTSATGIIIKETASDWIMGLKQQRAMSFDVSLDSTVAALEGTYDLDTNTINWGTLTWGTVSPAIPNSKLAADYEYFWHGERGDQYRYVGWPDYVPTEYLVDPNNVNGYDFLTMHYAYQGPNEDIQKSGKDITFLVERASTDTTAANPAAKTSTLKTAIEGAVNPLDDRYKPAS